MRKGISQTAKPRVFNRQLRNPGGGRVRLLLVLIVGILMMGSAASVTLAQEQPQPALPQQGIGASEQERQFDTQARELEARRTELERSLQRTQMQLQQLVLEQDQQRRGLQKELGDIGERLRDVNSQLADLPRQRLRVQYLAALQTLAQTRVKRQQAEAQAEAARLAEQEASIAAERLRQLLEQMPSIQPEPVAGPQSPQTAAETIERVLHAQPKPAATVEQQGCAGREVREDQGNTVPPGDNLLPQLEGLRGEICRAEEQMKALAAQMGTTRESLNREISAVRTDLRRMGQTLGRIEQERLEDQSNLTTNVEKLRGHLEEMQQLYQTQRDLELALLQAHRSTVGSAAYW